MIIGIDFDGTCVTHDFPKIGKDIGAARILKRLVESGHKLILWTVRSDDGDNKYLTEAVNWFKENDIELYGVNSNPKQKEWSSSPKAYCHFYIDDAAMGMPLIYNPDISYRPFVNWNAVENHLRKIMLITPY